MINRKNVKLIIIDYLKNVKSMKYMNDFFNDIYRQMIIKGEVNAPAITTGNIDEETHKIVYQCMNEIYVKGNKGIHTRIITRKKRYLEIDRSVTADQFDVVRKYYEETKTWSKSLKEQPKLTKEERLTLPIVDMKIMNDDNKETVMKFDGFVVIKQGDKYGLKKNEEIVVEPKFETIIEAITKKDSIMKFAFLASLNNEGVQQ